MIRLPAACILILCFLLTTSAEEAAPTVPSLIENSPFLPPGFQPPGSPRKAADAPASSSTYEFRGIYQLGGLYYYHLYNKREQKGNWFTESEAREAGVEIVDFDPTADELVVRVAGKQSNLALVETSDRTLPVQTARPAQASVSTQNRENTTVSENNRRRVIRPSVRQSRNTNRNVRRRVIRPANRN